MQTANLQGPSLSVLWL